MGRIITVLLIGLAPLIVLGIRECAPSLAPPPPPAELVLPADETLDPLPEPPAEEPTPAPAPIPEEPDQPNPSVVD